MKGNASVVPMVAAAAVSLASTVWAAETEFEFVGCGISKNVMVEANAGIAAFAMENWAINTSTATKGWEKATKHCAGYVRVMDKKPTGRGACKWLDASGDSAVFEWEIHPSGESTVTWLSGTGKYAGIKGGGNFATVANGKPVVEGTNFQCIRDYGKYTLP
jgi:hypothetical protein